MAEFLLETERLIIRNWREQDRNLFHIINSDEQVMAFFPFKRSRQQSDEMMNRIQSSISSNGYGFTALELKATNEPIGFCGLADATAEDPQFKELIEIGWRLAPKFWGKGYATEAAKRLLEFGFEELGLSEVVSFAVHNNHRSTSVMERIGMQRRPEQDFDHPGVPDTHPHLKRHVVYVAKRDE